jgi:hypothetical protein
VLLSGFYGWLIENHHRDNFAPLLALKRVTDVKIKEAANSILLVFSFILTEQGIHGRHETLYDMTACGMNSWGFNTWLCP